MEIITSAFIAIAILAANPSSSNEFIFCEISSMMIGIVRGYTLNNPLIVSVVFWVTALKLVV